MARIVELTYPDNVTLFPGAVQNWVDLPSPGAASPLLHRLVESLLAGLIAGPAARCLVVGPHDPALLRRLADRLHDLTVVVRSIPDAARIGTDLPTATVLCGTVETACRGRGPYDLVLALDDVTRTLSLEEDQHRPWRDLADTVVGLLAPGGTLALGIENELGLHRLTAPIDPRLRDDDANWSPLATWDASRPRTSAQVERFRTATGLTGSTYQLFPTWQGPTVMSEGLERSTRSLRHLLVALASRPELGAPSVPGLLQGRALAMADTFADACTGWVLVLGATPPVGDGPALFQAQASGTARWTAVDQDRVRCRLADTPELTVTVPPLGRTLLVDVIEAAVDSDTPRLRALLTGWRRRLEALAVDGVLPAAEADARFANLLSGATATDGSPQRAAGKAVPLEAAQAPAPLDEATWAALGDLLSTWRAYGIRHPWPIAMHPQTVFGALVAMAGAPAPQDPSRWFAFEDAPAPAGRQTRQELMAVIERQEEELRGAWSRFHWDEKDYLAYKAARFTRRTTRFVRREGLKRTMDRLRRLLKS